MRNTNNGFDYQAEFELYLTNLQYGPMTVKSYLADVSAFFLYLNAKESSAQTLGKLATVRALEGYISFLKQQGLSALQTDKRLQALSIFFEFAMAENYLQANPIETLVNKASTSETELLTKEFSQYLQQGGNSAKTIKSYLADVHEFLNIIN